jgi:hypothetical protein
MSDPNAVAGYRRMLARRGQPVIVRRINGDAPNVGLFEARVPAVVMDYQPKPPVGSVKPEGDITLGGRNVIVMANDLAALRFPLPLQKNDKVVVNPDPSQLGTGVANGDEELNVVAVDPYKRSIGGAIDLVAEGAA